MRVHGVGLVVDRAVGVKSATGRLVDEVMPVSVEAGDGAVVDADEKSFQRFLAGRRRQKEGEAEEEGVLQQNRA